MFFINFIVIFDVFKEMFMGDMVVYDGKEVGLFGGYEREVKEFFLVLVDVFREGDVKG